MACGDMSSSHLQEASSIRRCNHIQSDIPWRAAHMLGGQQLWCILWNVTLFLFMPQPQSRKNTLLSTEWEIWSLRVHQKICGSVGYFLSVRHSALETMIGVIVAWWTGGSSRERGNGSGLAPGTETQAISPDVDLASDSHQCQGQGRLSQRLRCAVHGAAIWDHRRPVLNQMPTEIQSVVWLTMGLNVE